MTTNPKFSFVGIDGEVLKENKLHVVIKSLEKNGLNIIAVKIEYPNKEKLSIYGETEDKVNKPYMAIILSAEDAVEKTKKLIGTTEPAKAGPKSIRYKLFPNETFELANQENRPIKIGVHCSGSSEIAMKEIDNWYSIIELQSYGILNDLCSQGFSTTKS